MIDENLRRFCNVGRAVYAPPTKNPQREHWEAFYSKLKNATLGQALCELPPKIQACWEAYRLGESYSEIGQRVSWSAGNVRRHIIRIRQAIEKAEA